MSSGRMALQVTLHTIDLPGRRKQPSANKAIKRSGEIGTMQHLLLTA
jgi:hypothetical protein